MEKTKILVISGRLGVGGAERFVSNLITFLDRKLFTIHLCLGTNQIEYPLPPDIQLSILANSHNPSTFKAVIGINSIIREFQPDIVLSTIGLANRWTGLSLTANKTVKPLWIARIGNNPTHGGRSEWRNRINLTWDKYIYKKADHFVVNSLEMKAAFSALHPRSKNRISVNYNPTNFVEIENNARLPTIHQNNSNTTVLIHAGRFHRQKRHDVLLEAFSLLLRKDYKNKLELWLCGDGYLKKSIQKQIKELSLENHVKLLGHIPNPYPVFKQANLFVLSSDWEGMPNVIIEAMGLGVPVVSTNCPFGPSEIIDHGQTGFLCPPSNPISLANTLSEALCHPRLSSIAKAGQASIKKIFDYNSNIQKWQDTLLTL